MLGQEGTGMNRAHGWLLARRLLVACGAVALLAGCGTQYRNTAQPDADYLAFDRDLMECRHGAGVVSADWYGSTTWSSVGYNVSDSRVKACMTGRGWQQVKD
jgi:hypothetical protein